MAHVVLSLVSLLAVSATAEPPVKLIFDGVKRSESTRAFKPQRDGPRPLPPLSEQQQALVAAARGRLAEIAEAEKMPRACSSEIPPRDLVADESRLVEEVVVEPGGTLLVTLRLWSRITEWQGKGCCPRCERPCEPASCGYCSPANSCRQFALERELEERLRITPGGRVLAEELVRSASKPVEVPRKPWVAPPPAEDEPGTVSPGLPVVRGLIATTLDVGKEIDRGKAEGFVAARRTALRVCYERELRRNPSLEGRVVITAAIGPGARTENVAVVESTLGNDAVDSCLKAVLRGWVWPFKPEQKVPFTCSMRFQPSN